MKNKKLYDAVKNLSLDVSKLLKEKLQQQQPEELKSLRASVFHEAFQGEI